VVVVAVVVVVHPKSREYPTVTADPERAGAALNKTQFKLTV